MNFVDSFKKNSNLTTTENGAVVYSTTNSSVLNLFARLGGLRDKSKEEILNLYHSARVENSELADNMILYARNIRQGGLGERRIGRILLNELAKIDPNKVINNFDTIVKCGRWDDLLCLIGTPVESKMLTFINFCFTNDLIKMSMGKPISLLSKWLPSINTSSEKTRMIAKKIVKNLGISEKEYRKILSSLRKYLDVTEKKMSNKEFDKIKYNVVPSNAMNRYKNAFFKHDKDRFVKYLTNISKGKEKINSSVLFPYDIVKPFLSRNYKEAIGLSVLEEQWKALPNYLSEPKNVVVMADVSGSMETNNYIPISSSIGLGIYFAERNEGAYKNLLMTFTNKPFLYNIENCCSLMEKINLISSHVGYNTNLDLALQKIYSISLSAKESPDALLIISDGEFDSYYCHYDGQTIIEKWYEKFEEKGLKFPKIISWNVNSKANRFLGDGSNNDVSFISGNSASVFKFLNYLIEKNANEAMIEILTKSQFQWRIQND